MRTYRNFNEDYELGYERGRGDALRRLNEDVDAFDMALQLKSKLTDRRFGYDNIEVIVLNNGILNIKSPLFTYKYDIMNNTFKFNFTPTDNIGKLYQKTSYKGSASSFEELKDDLSMFTENFESEIRMVNQIKVLANKIRRHCKSY